MSRLALDLLNGADPRDPLSVDVSLDRPPMPRRVAGVVTTGIGAALASGGRRGRATGRRCARRRPVGRSRRSSCPSSSTCSRCGTGSCATTSRRCSTRVGAVIDPRLVAALEGHIAYPYVTDLPRMAVYPERRRLMRVWSAMFATTPVVVTPVWPEPQFPGDDDLERGIDFIAHMLQFATPAPLLGAAVARRADRSRRRPAHRACRSTPIAGTTSTAWTPEPPSSRSSAP